MRGLILCIFMLSSLAGIQAIRCWLCRNARSQKECRQAGEVQQCHPGEICATEVRYHSGMGSRPTILKQCKQALACGNNRLQNNRRAWDPTQCNSELQNSVCRCCCETSLCNRDNLKCGRGNEICDDLPIPVNGFKNCVSAFADNEIGTRCTFSCEPGFQLQGSEISTCLQRGRIGVSYSPPAPTCVPIVPGPGDFPLVDTCSSPLEPPQHGNMRCRSLNDTSKFVSKVCRFNCHVGYELVGSPIRRCRTRGPKIGWDGEKSQCNRIKVLKAPICRPLAVSQFGGVVCTHGREIGSQCTLTCDIGYNPNEEGSSINCIKDREAAIWDAPIPDCVPENDEGTFIPICRDLEELDHPEHRVMACTGEREVGSQCTFFCNDGYIMDGAATVTCVDQDQSPVWDRPPPECIKVELPSCPEIESLNGEYITMSCTGGNSLGAQCTFSCIEGYVINGASTITCSPNGETIAWNAPVPFCTGAPPPPPQSCPELGWVQHGEYYCSDAQNIGSVCQFQCTPEGYELTPNDREVIFCGDNGTWSNRKPCCMKPCPPHAPMDVIIVMDSSRSVQKRGWNEMVGFVEKVITSFTLASDSANFGVFRFNNKVDKNSQILLSDHPSDKDGLLTSLNQIPYNGGGTWIGQALRHARTVMLSEENGNRPEYRDLVLVLTDGISNDNVTEEARLLRASGVTTFALGIYPRSKELNRKQLLSIAGDEEHFLVVEGLSGLTAQVVQKLSNVICTAQCL